MVWKKTEKSFSVRINGISYVYRSLNQKTKTVLLRCGHRSCSASVKFNLEYYWISAPTLVATKKSELCSLIDISKLVQTNPNLAFEKKNEHTCGKNGD